MITLIIGCVPKYNDTKNRFVVSSALIQQIIQNGNIPVFILNLKSLDLCDGVILSGGDDIHPWHYHQMCLEFTVLEDEWIEEIEFEIVRECKEKEIPLLGICRGMQVIHVAMGGSLLQHLDGHLNTSHSLIHTKSFATHIHEVHSYHHQCCIQLSQELTCCALSDDGYIEAFEGNLVWGIQWHPELENNDVILPFFFDQVLTNKINKNHNRKNGHVTI